MTTNIMTLQNKPDSILKHSFRGILAYEKVFDRPFSIKTNEELVEYMYVVYCLYNENIEYTDFQDLLTAEDLTNFCAMLVPQTDTLKKN